MSFTKVLYDDLSAEHPEDSGDSADPIKYEVRFVNLMIVRIDKL